MSDTKKTVIILALLAFAAAGLQLHWPLKAVGAAGLGVAILIFT